MYINRNIPADGAAQRRAAAYLIFELSDLPLAWSIALQVVQHNLSISQKDFGSLQVFLQPLLRLNVPLVDLEWQIISLLQSPLSPLTAACLRSEETWR